MKFYFQSARLVEQKDKEGKEWEVVLIQAGKSLNKKYYPADVLKGAVKLFDNAKAYAYEFTGKIFNHLPDKTRKVIPEGCVKNLVGWYENPRFTTFKDDEGKTQQGILATFHVSEAADWLRKLLKDAWEHGKHSLLGFSIDGSGDVSEVTIDGEKMLNVESINSIDEVTLVTHPAAGGQFVRLLASKNFIEEEEQMNWLKELYARVKVIKEALIEGVNPEKITPEQEFSFIKALIESDKFPPKEKISEEAPFMSAAIDRLIEFLQGDKKDEAMKLLSSLKEKLDKYGYPKYGQQGGDTEEAKKQAEAKKTAEAKKVQEDEETRRAQMAELDKVKEDMKIMREETAKTNCRAILTESLIASDLPQPIKDKITKSFSGKIFKKEDLDESIKDEKDVLGKLTESGTIKYCGTQKQSVEVLRESADKIQVAIDRMVDDEAVVSDKFKDIKGFTSLKEAYRACHPEDPNISGNIDRRNHMSRLTEAITTSDFTYALGTSMTRKLIKSFEKVAFDFAPICSETGIDNFKQQERVKWGGYSTLPSVTEDAAYTDLYEPKDEEATFTAGTKGGYVSVSRKTIKNDDLGLIRQIPAMVGTSARRTLARDVSALLLANGTYTPTNSTVFSTTFGNYSTRALNYDNLTYAENLMASMRERGSAIVSGTATSAASTTLILSTASWTTNAYQNYYVRIVYGTGAGQTRLISSNDATTLTITPAWTATPSTDSKFEISTATNDDEEIGLQAKYIIFGKELRGVVNALLKSEKRYDGAEHEDNLHKGTLTPIFCPYITGSTYQYYWFLAADRSQTEMIEIGYVDNQKTPTLVIQDQPALGEVFTNDRLRWKVRFEYGLAIIENKGLNAHFATTV